MKKDELLNNTEKVIKTDVNLAELLQSNLKYSEEILLEIKDIKKYIRWQKIWSTVRLLTIIVPLILGFIYLPPIIKDIIAYYKLF